MNENECAKCNRGFLTLLYFKYEYTTQLVKKYCSNALCNYNKESVVSTL